MAGKAADLTNEYPGVSIRQTTVIARIRQIVPNDDEKVCTHCAHDFHAPSPHVADLVVEVRHNDVPTPVLVVCTYCADRFVETYTAEKARLRRAGRKIT